MIEAGFIMTGIEEISSGWKTYEGNEIAIELNYAAYYLPQCSHIPKSGEVPRVVVAETDDDVARFCLDCLLEWVAEHRAEIGLDASAPENDHYSE